MVKYSTLIVVLGVMTLSIAVFATNADGAGIVWRAINKTGSSLFDIADVGFTSCSNGQVLKYQTSNSTWICSSGYTKVNNLDTAGTASILATNATLSGTQATFKTLTQGTGITLTNGTKTVTIANAGVTTIAGTSNNVTLSASTGSVTANLGSNVVITGGANQTLNKILYTNGFGMNYTRVTTTATTTMGDTGGIQIVSAGTGNRTVFLPTSTTNTGQLFLIMRNDTSPAKGNRVIIDAWSSEKIDGDLMYNLTRNGQAVLLQSTGTAWTSIFDIGEGVGRPGDAHLKGTGANRWYGSAMFINKTGTTTQKANTITATPFPVAAKTTFDQIQIDVVTLKAGSTCRAAIYTDNGNGYPDKLVTGSDVGTIATNAAGRVGNTFSGSITLSSGFYWLTAQCSGGGQVLRAWSNGAIFPTLGISSASGISAPTVGWNATFTYAAFPANFPGAGATLTTHGPAMVLVRPVG
ncbi:MAG: hypothetical protein EB154_09165 [Nitrosopumilaceae archaeon]|nr:hypothetical protein [Nitrososphaeria archaeon]NDF35994.1 hypothetical protein [Nitrosopumilaceae archaeon]